MTDLKAAARLTRWGAASVAHNLAQIPADKRDWKPTPEAKSALQVTGEITGVMRMMLPVFAGGEFTPAGLPHPTTLEEAVAALDATATEFADKLDAAGAELERELPSPYGTMWAAHAVLFGVIDLLHHHGQLTYIQSLLGDSEVHMHPTGMQWFAPPAA